MALVAFSRGILNMVISYLNAICYLRNHVGSYQYVFASSERLIGNSVFFFTIQRFLLRKKINNEQYMYH